MKSVLKLMVVSVSMVMAGCATQVSQQAQDIEMVPQYSNYVESCERIGKYSEEVNIAMRWNNNEQRNHAKNTIKNLIAEGYPQATAFTHNDFQFGSLDTHTHIYGEIFICR